MIKNKQNHAAFGDAASRKHLRNHFPSKQSKSLGH